MDPTLAAAAAFFVAAASPGPATLAVSATAMAHGTRTALLFGLGLAAGLAFWGVLAAAGLGALLAQSAGALFALRLAGGAYLLVLAVRSARSALSGAPDPALPAQRPARPLLSGLLLNLSNPKAVLAWMAVLALGLAPERGGAHLALTTALLAVLGLAIYAAYAILFARPRMRAAYRRARRGIEAVLAGAFAFAGLRLILSRGAP